MALSPGTRIGPYEIAAQIGVGGMGEVYRATDTQLKRAVAIKVLPAAVATDPERLARFQREAEVLAALNHPNIAQIHGLEKSSGTVALVMELVDGPTLAGRIAEVAPREGAPDPADVGRAFTARRGLPLDEALPIAKQIAEALEAAHEQGIIHRDLKPANIKVRPDGTVKVLDFGLAKAMESHPVEGRTAVSQAPTITTPALVTGAGMILGTAAYMSPEQARGKPVDKRADIWAFGCVLYEMLTGTRAFGGDDVTDTLAFVITKEPAWELVPVGIAPALLQLLRRCLEKDARLRLRDIGDARLELNSPGNVAVPPPAVALREGRLRSQHALVAVTAVMGLMLVAVTPVAIQHLREPEEVRASARFTVELPVQVRLPLGRHVPSISPDGTQIVFVGQTAQGDSLWVRSLGSLDVRELPGTLGVGGVPFWSPDSQHVAFLVGQRLWRLRLSDGSREPLAELPASGAVLFRGGTWSTDGSILAATDAGLFLITSGRTEALSLVDRDGESVSPFFPVFLPDGRQFLYSALSDAPGRSGLYIGFLDGSPSLLLDAAQIPSLVHAQEHVIYVRDGFPVARPFDSSRLAWAGEPQPLGEQGIAGLSVSANGLLVYKNSVVDVTQLTWVNRSGRAIGTLGPPDRYPTFDLSPDDRRAVVARGSLNADMNLWVFDVDGSVVRLTTGAFRDVDPRWSADGSRIMFASTRAPGRSPHELPASGGIPTLWMPSPSPSSGNFSLDDWSPDGRLLLHHTTGVRGLSVVPVVGARQAATVGPPLSGLIDQGRFSPDSRFIAYNSEQAGAFQVYVEPFPSTGERWQVSPAGGAQPMWRADGRELFFLNLDGELLSADVDTRNGFRVTAVRTLFKTSLRADVQVEEYAVASSGDRFLMALPVSGSSSASFTVVTDWTSLLAR